VSASDESREGDRSSQALSAGALAQLNRDNHKRSRGGGGVSPAKKKTRPERTKKVAREDYRELTRDAERERHDRHREKRRGDGKKRRVVSGAVMEEGRVRNGLRGGGHWSEDSLEKDYYNTKAPKKRSKKRLCGFILLLQCVLSLLIRSQGSSAVSSSSS
jgi:glucan 1,3-beta-glucosidase